jgi:hypothetical protein
VFQLQNLPKLNLQLWSWSCFLVMVLCTYELYFQLLSNRISIIMCKIVLLGFIHCLKYKIVKLQYVKSCILLLSLGKKVGNITENLSVGLSGWPSLRPGPEFSSHLWNLRFHYHIHNIPLLVSVCSQPTEHNLLRLSIYHHLKFHKCCLSYRFWN